MAGLRLDSFVAVDLETTGMDPNSDGVIEIAAVKFENGQETGVFAFLTNPGQPIALRIQHLTGITDAMVQDKPSVMARWPEFLTFVAGLPLVIHNAAFDAPFLHQVGRRTGTAAPAALYDTLDLARVALPLAGSYRLGQLAALLSIPLEKAHRAEDDARAAGYLFLECIRRLEAVDLGALETMLGLAGGTKPLSVQPLLLAVVEAKAASGDKPSRVMDWIKPAVGPIHETGDRDEKEETPPTWLDLDYLSSLLGPGGAVAESFGRYENRPQQLAMTREIAGAMNQGRHLLMEAGTGTGKSLAYLLPAMAWAKETAQKVVISTHTITLQEQLWEKDIPFLQAALEGTKYEGVKAALVKGRGNYICLRKWEEQVTQADLFMEPEERSFHVRMASWLSVTETGDRAELGLFGAQEEQWAEVMSEDQTCLGPKCKWYKNHCFAFRQRRKAAREADILIINHSLLFANLNHGNLLLPPFQHLIVDEAHHLETVATQSMGVDLSQHDLYQALAFLFRSYRADAGPGFLPQLKRGLQVPIPARPPLGASHEDMLEKLIEAVTLSRVAVDECFGQLRHLVERQGGQGEEGGRQLRLTATTRATPAWTAIETARSNLSTRLRTLSRGLGTLVEILEALQPPPRELDAWVVNLEKYAGQIYQAAKDIDLVLEGDEPARVSWLELIGRGAQPAVRLRLAPVDVAPLLREQLWEKVRSATLTSATLSVNEKFDHIMARLGLHGMPPDRLQSRLVKSPFRYQEQALVLVPSDVPNPKAGDAAFTDAVCGFLRQFLPAMGGSTLVLFTSHKMLRAIRHDLQDEMSAAGLVLLAQGIDGSRSKLVEEFKAAPGSVLLGSASFWEGVDIPGNDLRAVVLVKLPFSPPGDPVTEARMEDLERRGMSPFVHLSLPEAIIRFKQGFGRLIRTRSDKGVVVVFDNRVHGSQTRYGPQFLRSLPGPRLQVLPQDQVVAAAKAWLKEEPF